MHGRVKVKTSAEQAEAKRKEKEKKAKAYLSLCKDFLVKHHNKEYSEENLKLCSSILELNPDFSSGWNYRKEAFLHMLESNSEEEVRTLAKAELHLTEVCLRTNPKAYCVWIHRLWTLQHCPSPDWSSELDFCQLALKLDERNFHCWDHRRAVCQEAQVPAHKELDFSMQKISTNFSNQSAWHYRSKLLPQVEDLTQDVIAREISLVENAVFTDPADQSAWLYMRWLAGVALKAPPCVCLVAHTPGRLLVQLSAPLTTEEVHSQLQLMKNGSLVPEVSWRNCLPADPQSPLWEVELELAEGDEAAVMLGSDSPLTCQSGGTLQAPVPPRDPHGWISQLLNICLQLQELEPDSKYPFLMAAELIEESAEVTRSGVEDMVNYYQQLIAIDCKRINLYMDRISRAKAMCRVKYSWLLGQPQLSLAGMELTALPCLLHLATLRSLDLSSNRLSSLQPLRHLVSLQTLRLDSNHLRCLQGLEGLRQLQELYLRHNQICDIQELVRLSDCRDLHTLALEGNPLPATVESLLQVVQQILPQVSVLL